MSTNPLVKPDWTRLCPTFRYVRATCLMLGFFFVVGSAASAVESDVVDLSKECENPGNLKKSGECLMDQFIKFTKSTNELRRYQKEEFYRRMGQNRNLRNIFSIIYKMEEEKLVIKDMLLSDLATGRKENNPRLAQDGISEFEVDINGLHSFWDPDSEDNLDDDLLVSVNILATRNYKHVALESVVNGSTRGNKIPMLTLNQDVILKYDIIDLKTREWVEGILLKPGQEDTLSLLPYYRPGYTERLVKKMYGEQSDAYKKIIREFGSDFNQDLIGDLKKVFGMYSEEYSNEMEEIKSRPSEFRKNETKRVVVSVWDIVEHFLNGSSDEKRTTSIDNLLTSEEKQIYSGKKVDRAIAFERISKRNEIYADDIIQCESPEYFDPEMTSSDLSPDELMNRIVFVFDKTANNTGSGFYIDDNLVITNEHVVDGAIKKWLEDDELSTVSLSALGDSDEFEGIVVGYDKRRDLALLDVTRSGTPFLLYKGELPSRGAEVSAFGNPKGIQFIYTQGVVSRADFRYNNGVWIIITDAASNKGNSGGPLVYDGKVVGVNFAARRADIPGEDIEGLNYAVRYDEIHAFLRQQGLDLFKEPGKPLRDRKAILKCVLPFS